MIRNSSRKTTSELTNPFRSLGETSSIWREVRKIWPLSGHDVLTRSPVFRSQTSTVHASQFGRAASGWERHNATLEPVIANFKRLIRPSMPCGMAHVMGFEGGRVIGRTILKVEKMDTKQAAYDQLPSVIHWARRGSLLTPPEAQCRRARCLDNTPKYPVD